MSVTLENGKLTVSASYGITKNLGDYSSEKLSQSIALEFDVEGDSAQILAAGQAQQDVLVKSVKLAVMAELGIEGKTDDNGTLVPVIGAPAAVAATPIAAAPSYGGGAPVPGGSQQFKPKADISANPRFAADLDGTGAKLWIDLRPTKASGAFSPNAADFRDAEDSKHQVWLSDKSGAVKASVAEALTAAGVAV